MFLHNLLHINVLLAFHTICPLILYRLYSFFRSKWQTFIHLLLTSKFVPPAHSTPLSQTPGHPYLIPHQRSPLIMSLARLPVQSPAQPSSFHSITWARSPEGIPDFLTFIDHVLSLHGLSPSAIILPTPSYQMCPLPSSLPSRSWLRPSFVTFRLVYCYARSNSSPFLH